MHSPRDACHSSRELSKGLGLSRGLAKICPEDFPYDSLRDSEDTSENPTQTLQRAPSKREVKDLSIIDSNNILGDPKDYLRGHSKDVCNAFPEICIGLRTFTKQTNFKGVRGKAM